ncbi:MAG: prevent-host-death family protein [Verrucomicrobiales bacterium]|jgi:prevent-host-death family protein
MKTAKIINLHEAKTHLSRLVEEAAAGKEIIVGKAGKPMVKLIPYETVLTPRKGGQLAGQIQVTDDCWDFDPLAESIAAPLYPDAEPISSLRVAEKPAKS